MTSPLWKLSRQVREHLALALEARRLGPPYTRFSLQRYVETGLADEIAAECGRLSGLGFTPEQLAIVLRMLAEQPKDGPDVNLVWTGPDVGGASSRDTGVVVRETFDRAERSILIAGFAIYQGKRVFERLAQRMEQIPELVVRMFLHVERKYQDTTASEQLLAQFAHEFRTNQWPGKRLPQVYYDPRTLEVGPKRASLHAKCVVVDERWLLIGSANFTEAAQERNIEVGVWIEDRALSQMLVRQFEGLVAAKQLVRVPGI